jgi:UDP-glucose 4-epimerase
MEHNQLSGLRCVVLGGGGFIGTHLCRRLKGRVADLKAFGRRQSFPEALDGIEWFQGDFGDPSSIAAAIEGCDTVFHLVNATTPSSANADKVADVRLNVIASLQLLEICKAQNVKRIVFASSGGTIYGIPTIIPTPEDAECWPITSYGISKLAIERFLRLYEYLHNIEFRVLRISNPYGPLQLASKNQGVIGAFLRRMQAGQPVEIWGDGSVSRDYLYINDVVDAFELAALHSGPERIFNIGSGVARTLNEVVESLQEVTGLDCNVVKREARMVDVPVSLLDITRARDALGWKPKTSFADGLEQTFSWLKSASAKGAAF